MNLEQLLVSEYAKRFDISISKYRDDVIHIFNPNMIAIPTNELKITENEGFIWLEIAGKLSVTLYLESGTSHTSIY